MTRKLATFYSFITKKGKNTTNPANKICAVYGPNAVPIRVAQMWFKCFKSAIFFNFSVKDEVRSGESQIKPVPVKWSMIDLLVATVLLKNWMLIIKQFYVIYKSLGTRH